MLSRVTVAAGFIAGAVVSLLYARCFSHRVPFALFWFGLVIVSAGAGLVVAIVGLAAIAGR